MDFLAIGRSLAILRRPDRAAVPAVPAARARERGVTAPEALVAMLLLVMLAGVVVPATSLESRDEQAERIVELAKRLERAVFRHYVDVRDTATEFSLHGSEVEAYHELTHGRGRPRFAGPYLDRGLSREDNPCGGEVLLYPDLTGGVASPKGGFDPSGRGRDTAVGKGQFVAFTEISEDVARRVEVAIDGGIAGGAWRERGRVEYDSAKRHLMILLLES
jgi:type II secretory pathway pseudopilin PulG